MDLFEEELEGDYEEMLSKFEKKKVLQVRGSLFVVRSKNWCKWAQVVDGLLTTLSAAYGVARPIDCG